MSAAALKDARKAADAGDAAAVLALLRERAVSELTLRRDGAALEARSAARPASRMVGLATYAVGVGALAAGAGLGRALAWLVRALLRASPPAAASPSPLCAMRARRGSGGRGARRISTPPPSVD